MCVRAPPQIQHRSVARRESVTQYPWRDLRRLPRKLVLRPRHNIARSWLFKYLESSSITIISAERGFLMSLFPRINKITDRVLFRLDFNFNV